MNMKAAFLIAPMAFLALTVQNCAADDLRSASGIRHLFVAWDIAPEAGGSPTAIVSRAGDLAHYRVNKDQSYAIAATPEDRENPSSIVFRILTVKVVPGAGEVLKQVEKFSLRPGASYSTSLKPALTIRLKKLSMLEETESSVDLSEKPPTLVAWEVTTPSKQRVRFVGKDGETVRLELPGGRVVGMEASVRDSKNANFRLLELGSEANARQPVDAFTVSVGGEHTASGFAFRLTSIRPNV